MNNPDRAVLSGGEAAGPSSTTASTVARPSSPPPPTTVEGEDLTELLARWFERAATYEETTRYSSGEYAQALRDRLAEVERLKGEREAEIELRLDQQHTSFEDTFKRALRDVRAPLDAEVSRLQALAERRGKALEAVRETFEREPEMQALKFIGLAAMVATALSDPAPALTGAAKCDACEEENGGCAIRSRAPSTDGEGR